MIETILKHYPGLTSNDITLRDDGEGIFISYWNSTEPQPSMDQVNQWAFDDSKILKMNTLDEQCNLTILNGFDYTINNISYQFSLSLSAQSNFQETGDMFKEGKITSEIWTVVNNTTGKIERITLDQPTFEAVRDVGRAVVRDNISKLRDTLQPQVELATTQSELDAIVW